MPRMSKKRKHELSFYLNDRGRVTYNELCRKCQHGCKQSFRAVLWPLFPRKSPRNTTLKSAIRLLRLLRLKWADFCLRRHHAENAEKEEAGTVFLPQ